MDEPAKVVVRSGGRQSESRSRGSIGESRSNDVTGKEGHAPGDFMHRGGNPSNEDTPNSMKTLALSAARQSAELISRNISVEQATELAKLAGEHSQSLRALLEAEIENSQLRRAVETLHETNSKLLAQRFQREGSASYGKSTASPGADDTLRRASRVLDGVVSGEMATHGNPEALAQLTDEMARTDRIKSLLSAPVAASGDRSLAAEAEAAASAALMVADRLAALSAENNQLRTQ